MRHIYIYLQKIPFKRDSVEWYNIYISVILTLLNSITPTDLQMKKIKEALPKNKDEVIDKIYKELRNAPAILYHLDNSMQPYIKALAVEIKHAISAEMSRECKYFISPDNTLKNLLINTYNYQQEILGKAHENSVGVYIGIPFCPTRCLYCSFTSQSIKFSNTLIIIG